MRVNLRVAMMMSLTLFATASVAADQVRVRPGAAPDESSSEVTITRSESQPPIKGPAERFTGTVWIESRFQGTEPARVGGGLVTFEPGARSDWHTHPLGQTLIVTSGTGWVQQQGRSVQEIKQGDIVWIPPGVKHWHGATPTTGMAHIAIAEALGGRAVDWMEKVSDAQYRR
jgi:quercetin dioxygenase-like cupin family protein